MKENKPGFRITTLHAFVSIDQDGDEGVCSFMSDDGIHWPMICADDARLKELRPIAEGLARVGAKMGLPNKIKLVKFSVREDLDTL